MKVFVAMIALAIAVANATEAEPEPEITCRIGQDTGPLTADAPTTSVDTCSEGTCQLVKTVGTASVTRTYSCGGTATQGCASQDEVAEIHTCVWKGENSNNKMDCDCDNFTPTPDEDDDESGAGALQVSIASFFAILLAKNVIA